MENETLAILWEQYLSGRMSKAERKEFSLLMQDPGNQEFFGRLLNSSMEDPEIPLQADAKKEKHIRQVLGSISPNTAPVVHRAHFFNRRWFRYAAVVTLLLGTGGYLMFRPTQTNNTIAGHTSDQIKNIQPGGDRAMLTLADGSTIMLDSASAGKIAEQGNAQIMKDADGNIVYDQNGSKSAASMMNTMRTPKGGKYQLTLPDGTKVWLNAASSITFPVVFPEQGRTVKITGEVYFEVKPDKARPFSVSSGKANVLVLGTSFNVNAYEDEDDLKVTLLNGSVKISDIQSKQAIMLTPGQQAQLSADRLSATSNVDVQQVMAWKNDLFNFEDVDLEDAMRQISRWYDVRVIYESGIPKTQLWGKMSRNTSFDRLLRNLKDVGVNYRVNEKRELIILQ